MHVYAIRIYARIGEKTPLALLTVRAADINAANRMAIDAAEAWRVSDGRSDPAVYSSPIRMD